jgi:hypothetical protein
VPWVCSQHVGDARLLAGEKRIFPAGGSLMAKEVWSVAEDLWADAQARRNRAQQSLRKPVEEFISGAPRTEVGAKIVFLRSSGRNSSPAALALLCL